MAATKYLDYDGLLYFWTLIKGKLALKPDTDTKNTAGATDTNAKIYLVGATVELSARMEHRVNNSLCRLLFCRMHIHRNSSSVIRNCCRSVFINRDGNIITIACKMLVNRVIDYFLNQMIKTASACISDIHTRTQSDRFKSF